MESRQYIFNNSTLTVKFGNILDTKAEVIVSSDDCYITMGGGVSRAILQAGGDIIIKDAQKMCPVPLGDVVVTTAGKMEKQKYVYHCITIDKKRRLQILSRQVTEEDVLNYLLQHAVVNGPNLYSFSCYRRRRSTHSYKKSDRTDVYCYSTQSGLHQQDSEC